MADLSMFDITGKKALVTGGASGMGRIIALRMAKRGTLVAILDRDAKKLEEIIIDGGLSINGNVGHAETNVEGGAVES